MKKRWAMIAGAGVLAVVLLIGILSLANGYFILAPGVKMELNGEETIEIDAFSKYEDAGAVAHRGREDLTDKIKTEGEVDVKKPGTYVITYRLTRGDKEYTVERSVTVVDHEAPVLKLKGKKEMTVSLQSLYEEPGFTAKDRCDGKLTKQVVITQDMKDDVMTLTYKVQDSSGNEATAQRIVTIRDEVLPRITLHEGNMYVPVGSKFQDPGYSAKDDADGDLMEIKFQTAYLTVQ